MSSLVNAKEAAEILRVSPRQIVERLRHRKGFPKPMRPGKEYLWHENEIVGWMKSTKSRV